MLDKELVKRLLVAALGVPLALALVYYGGWALAVGLSVIAALATREFYVLGRQLEVLALPVLGITGSSLVVLSAGLTRSFETFSPFAFGLVLGAFLLSGVSAIWLRWPGGKPLSAVPLTVTGILYGGGCLSFAILLRHFPDTQDGFQSALPFQGQLLLIFPLATTWLGDTAAYFFGHALGNRKLIPAVSPGKTVVGGVAGLMTAGFAGMLLGGFALEFHPVPVSSALLGGAMGLVLGVAAQVGDLVESVLKREAGVKDSGTIFPGHGGILDRFDALIFSLPVAYALVRLVWIFQ